MKKNYLFFIFFALAGIGILFVFFSRTDKLDIEKFVIPDKQTSMKAVIFVQDAMKSRTNEGDKGFRNFWRKVSDMQYISNTKSLGSPKITELKIISVVKPKAPSGQVYVYARFPKLEHDVQFVLEKADTGFKISGIYESRSFR